MCHFLPVHHLGIVFLGRVEGQNITCVSHCEGVLFTFLCILVTGVYVSTHVCELIYTYTRTHMYFQGHWVDLMYARMCIFLYTDVFLSESVCVCMRLCVYVCLCVHTIVHILFGSVETWFKSEYEVISFIWSNESSMVWYIGNILKFMLWPTWRCFDIWGFLLYGNLLLLLCRETLLFSVCVHSMSIWLQFVRLIM